MQAKNCMMEMFQKKKTYYNDGTQKEKPIKPILYCILSEYTLKDAN